MRTIEQIRAELEKERAAYRLSFPPGCGAASPFWQKQIKKLAEELSAALLAERAEQARIAKRRAEIADGIPLDRLEEICQAEHEGRCVTLPVKVGQTVYVLLDEQIYETEIYHIDLWDHTTPTFWSKVGDQAVDRYEKSFGKTIFLTREAAEAALKGANHD